MANIIHACVRFEAQDPSCQTFDWCTNIDLDTESEEDLIGRAELYLASLQANFAVSERLTRPLGCDYFIAVTTVFPE